MTAKTDTIETFAAIYDIVITHGVGPNAETALISLAERTEHKHAARVRALENALEKAITGATVREEEHATEIAALRADFDKAADITDRIVGRMTERLITDVRDLRDENDRLTARVAELEAAEYENALAGLRARLAGH